MTEKLNPPNRFKITPEAARKALQEIRESEKAQGERAGLGETVRGTINPPRVAEQGEKYMEGRAL